MIGLPPQLMPSLPLGRSLPLPAVQDGDVWIARLPGLFCPPPVPSLPLTPPPLHASYCRARRRTKAEGSAAQEEVEIRSRMVQLLFLQPTRSHTGIGTGRLPPRNGTSSSVRYRTGRYMHTEQVRDTGACLDQSGPVQYPSARRCSTRSAHRTTAPTTLLAFPPSTGDHLYVVEPARV